MLKSTIRKGKESLWTAGVAALALHGAMIAAIALGTTRLQVTDLQGKSPQNFCVEMTFALPSPLRTDSLAEEFPDSLRDEALQNEGLKDTETSLHKIHARSVPPEDSPGALKVRKVLISDRRVDKPLKPKASKSFPKAIGEITRSPLAPLPSRQPSGTAGVREKRSEEEGSNGMPVYAPPPLYPYEAKRKRLQGIVLIRLLLTETGIVHKAVTLPPRLDSLLEEAALTAVHKWRFKPLSKTGMRTVEVPIEFKLAT